MKHYIWRTALGIGAVMLACMQSVQAQQAGTTGPIADDGIIGGEYAKRGDNPFQVALVKKGSPDSRAGLTCGGSLIAPRVVLTAAHCSIDLEPPELPENWQVRAKLLDLRQKGVRVDVARIIPHPKYDPSSEVYDYDVGIWILAKPIKGIRMPSLARSDPPPGAKLLVTGWGRIEAGKRPSRLRKVSIPTVSNEVCDGAMARDVTPRMICAGIEGDTRDICSGDSGGPASRGSGNRILTGVVSWSACGLTDRYAVFARVSDPEIRKFIREAAGAYLNEAP